MTVAYERSSAGAVMLKIATMVRVLPIPMRLRREEKMTMSQTELRGVSVVELMREKNLLGC
jgi:hypothetical protein